MKRIIVILIPMLLIATASVFSQTANQTPQDEQLELLGHFVYFGAQGGNQLDLASSKSCYIGTMGAMVSDGTYNYILSNNHVLARTNKAAIGEDIQHLASSVCDSSPLHIGNLSKFIPLQFNRKIYNTVDAAIARITPNVVSNGDMIGSDFEHTFTVSNTTRSPAIGSSVQKSGRTTGLTFGVITTVNANVQVKYEKIAYFKNQIIIQGTNGTTFSAGGDSGSLIVSQDVDSEGGHLPVGLLFAGSTTTTIANPIDSVLNALGVSFHLSDDVGSLEDQSTSDEGSGTNPGNGNNKNQSVIMNPGIAIASAARDKHEEQFMNLSGVLGSGIGYDENGAPAIRIFVKNKTPKIDTLIPGNMEGIPVQIIETDEFIAF